MDAYVVLTALLIQRGSPESKKPDGEAVDDDPRAERDNPDAPGPVRRGGLALTGYEHSLSLALFGLFPVLDGPPRPRRPCRVQPAAAGARPDGRVAVGLRHQLKVLVPVDAELAERVPAVAAPTVLGIFLRQRGSPGSKPVAPHAQTGSG
jgi:hypothetical protein